MHTTLFHLKNGYLDISRRRAVVSNALTVRRDCVTNRYRTYLPSMTTLIPRTGTAHNLHRHLANLCGTAYDITFS